jgi:hypothetical protein
MLEETSAWSRIAVDRGIRFTTSDPGNEGAAILARRQVS